MPLDVLGRTRATLLHSIRIFLGREVWVIFESATCLGSIVVIFNRKRGIPSKRESSARIDYVPALCTHRPSLLPIERSGEIFGPEPSGSSLPCRLREVA